jgi:hypothetical protein
MEEYYLNPKVVYEILKAKGVKYLYHANSVLTSLTFIQQNSLLSRAFVQKNGLLQTPQKSDEEDKKFNVWDDVFLDGLDLHKKYSRPNNYGPVLFALKLELLQAPSLPPLLVTSNNPWFWKDGEHLNERYCSTTNIIQENYLTGKRLDSRIMFTFRIPETRIRLKKYLRGVIIDKPAILVNFQGGQKNIGDYTHDKIREALDMNGMQHISMKFRHADQTIHFCACNFSYTFMFNRNNTEFIKRFSSKAPNE